MFDVSEFESEPIKRIDDSPKEYKFQVYQFNTNSGNGSAYFADKEGSISNIKVYARGKDDYKNTSFTKSMDEGKAMIFKGIGEYKDEKLIKVTSEL